MSASQRYSFVNAHPQTKAEKLEARVAIRSHIGRWTQENQQRSSSKTLPANVERVPASSQAFPPSQQLLEPPPTVSLWRDGEGWRVEPGDPGVPDDSDEEEVFGWKTRTGQGRELVDSCPSSSSSDASRASIEPLGSGLLDPFQTYPSLLPVSLVSECNDYSLRVLWPGLTPASVNGIGSPAVRGWFSMALQDITAFNSLVFGALSHRRLSLLRRGGDLSEAATTKLDLDMKRAETTSISLINLALQNPNQELSDGLIVSVLCLASNAWDMSVWESKIQPVFDPPLKSLQWLDLYGVLRAHPVHAAGLAQIVALRGGLQNIQTPGLAATISFFGIISASKSLTYPPFPFVPLLDNGGDPPDLSRWANMRTRGLSTGLDFSRLLGLGLTIELATVLVAMQVYEHTVHQFSDGALLGLDPASICDQRNLIQYTLLSLAPPKDSVHFLRSHPIYEPIRLAALIYSVTVIFPIPPPAVPLGSLTRTLRSALRESDMRSGWASSWEAQCLLLWVLLIGGVAARDLPEERMWYIAALGRLTAQRSIKRFEDLKLQVLTKVLWLEQACDVAGRSLWAEILELGG